MCRGIVQLGFVSQTVEAIRRKFGNLFQASEHRQKSPGGHVPDCKRLRAGRRY